MCDPRRTFVLEAPRCATGPVGWGRSGKRRMETPRGRVKATGVCVTLAALIVASPGIALAQKGEDHFVMGIRYLMGRGVKQDNAEATKWFRKAAEQGHARGQANLGLRYGEGRGVPQSDVEALKWFRKAAEQGDGLGQANLGWMYQYGRGVPQSDAEALNWFRKAAWQGHAGGQSNLGRMIAEGRGVPQSDAEAVWWFRKAAEQGDEYAQNELRKRGLTWTARPRETEAPRAESQPVPSPTAFAPHPPEVEGSAPQQVVTATTRRPNVTINHPKDHAKIASESVTLAGIVTAPNGVARVNVAVNGSELPASRGITIAPAGGNTVPVNIRIPLQVGENVIVLTALDRSGEASQAVRTVYREGILPGVQIPGGATPIPSASTERWAVVIGIDQYRDPSIAQLQYGVADAKVFYEFLISKGGVKRSNARLLLNKDATQVNIRRALGDFLKQKALKEDEVVIYYAGHGTTEPEPGAEGGLAKYLVPWDADPKSLFATGIPMEEIDRIFSRIAARKILLVQDTCFSGGAGGRTFLRRGTTRAATLTDKFLQDLSSREGRMILTASDANQLSVESPEVGHGLFTYYLLQGLGGTADLDSDGAITVREIHLFLQRKVHERSGGNQTPQLYSIGDMVIVRTKQLLPLV